MEAQAGADAGTYEAEARAAAARKATNRFPFGARRLLLGMSGETSLVGEGAKRLLPLVLKENLRCHASGAPSQKHNPQGPYLQI